MKLNLTGNDIFHIIERKFDKSIFMSKKFIGSFPSKKHNKVLFVYREFDGKYCVSDTKTTDYLEKTTPSIFTKYKTYNFDELLEYISTISEYDISNTILENNFEYTPILSNCMIKHVIEISSKIEDVGKISYKISTKYRDSYDIADNGYITPLVSEVEIISDDIDFITDEYNKLFKIYYDIDSVFDTENKNLPLWTEMKLGTILNNILDDGGNKVDNVDKHTFYLHNIEKYMSHMKPDTNIRVNGEFMFMWNNMESLFVSTNFLKTISYNNDMNNTELHRYILQYIRTRTNTINIPLFIYIVDNKTPRSVLDNNKIIDITI